MKKQRYMANASLKYEILDWLDVTGRVRIDNATNDYSDKRNASTDLYFTNSSIYGFYKYYKADDRQAYADVMANINKRFGDLSLVLILAVVLLKLIMTKEDSKVV